MGSHNTKAQATMECLAAFLLFITCATLIIIALLPRLQAAKSSAGHSQTELSLSNSALNLGLFYLYGQPAPNGLARQQIPLRLQAHAVMSGGAAAYTLNPSQGASYAYSQKNIPN